MTVQRVAVVGTGVIGASWAAHFLAHGLDVTASDPAPGAEARLRADVAAHWPVLERFGLAEGASQERLSRVQKFAHFWVLTGKSFSRILSRLVTRFCRGWMR